MPTDPSVLFADLPVRTIALSLTLAVGLFIVALGLIGPRWRAAIVRPAVFLVVAAAAGWAAMQIGADGPSESRAAPVAAPAREAPRLGLGPREVIAYMDGGAFAVSGRVNGVSMDFIVDTGATAVVLTAEDAARMGYGAGRLDYSITVSTANGTTRAAPLTLDRIAVDGIEIRDVRALVAQPGDLAKNLLGMTFLSRLASYEVSGDRLMLRGR